METPVSFRWKLGGGPYAFELSISRDICSYHKILMALFIRREEAWRTTSMPRKEISESKMECLPSSIMHVIYPMCRSYSVIVIMYQPWHDVMLYLNESERRYLSYQPPASTWQAMSYFPNLMPVYELPSIWCKRESGNRMRRHADIQMGGKEVGWWFSHISGSIMARH